MSDDIPIGPGEPCDYCGEDYGQHLDECPLRKIAKLEAELADVKRRNKDHITQLEVMWESVAEKEEEIQCYRDALGI